MKNKYKNPFNNVRQRHYKLAWDNTKSKYSRILDFGCGYGCFIGPMSVKAVTTYGYDVDKNRIKDARLNYPKIRFTFGKVGHHLSYKNNFFDIVFMFHVLEHVQSEELTLNEIYRILKKDGLLILASPYKGLFSWADMANLRYSHPSVHKTVGKYYYGKVLYGQLFNSKSERGLSGDSSLSRKWHTHYKEKDLYKLFSKRFVIKRFEKYSLFQPFLLDVINIWKFVFKKESKFLDYLVRLDNQISAGEWSYNFFLIAQKINN